jgi:hypothetical protein
MNHQCEHCGIRLEPEPGFYQGAMYVSYGFTVVSMAIISGMLYGMGITTPGVYTGVIIGITVLIAPLNFRYSRILYLYLFGGMKHLKRN